MNKAVALLAGMLPLYVIRLSLFGIPTNVFEVAVWVTALFVVFRRALSSRNPRRISSWALIFIAFFLFSAIISTVISSELLSSLGILKGWIITPMVFGFLVYTVGKRDKIIQSLIISGLVVALFGISQIHSSNRIYSLYDVPNSLALFLVPISIITTRLGFLGKNRFYQYAAIVMLIAIIFTQSFGAIIALVGTSLFVIPGLTRDPDNRRGFRLGGRNDNVIYSVVGLLVITIAIFTFSGRIPYIISPLTNPGTTNSATVRLQLWDIGFDLIKKHPVLGIGLGQFEPAYQAELHKRFASYVIPGLTRDPRRQLQPEFVFRDPHNWIISFWLNTGLLGLISFIGLNYIAIRRPFSSHENIYKQAIALALISMLIFGLFDTIYWKNDLSALWWLLICLCLL